MSYEENGLKLFTGSQVRVEMEARKKALIEALGRHNPFRSGTNMKLAEALTDLLDYALEFTMATGSKVVALGLQRELYLALAQHGARVTRVRTHNPELTDDGKKPNVAEYVYQVTLKGTLVLVPIRFLEGALIRIEVVQPDGRGRNLSLA